MNDFLELAKERYSLRKFKNQPIEKETMKKILEAASASPTAVNYQPQRILIIDDSDLIQGLKEATKYTFNAPVILMIAYDEKVSWKRGYDGQDSGIIDASIVASHIMLEAHELGLGSTWVGSFDPKKVKDILRLEESIVPVALFPMGYPAEEAHPSGKHDERQDLNQWVSHNQMDIPFEV